ncbi:NAD-dependent epimerase/dehydratase [Paenibacillus curdlanolyticus YK9]|uniref:NAD-dependent epimerase/dehydratase n=1 Tax=Paenibacillus curdlanolyticus YK9 TaxID=717606 RepID=E0I9I8_9BACL|nr:NAD(P)H-binding protein [Paenibacillus curdlanolyticus]EFM11072.1 NAD-dependent epimerase/dehydratase [Paenibacillus curdlanolyticus YK9]
MKKAVVFGASGFVGSHLLDQLLNSAEYERVTAIVRSNLPIRHPKLNMLIGDLDTLPELKDQIEADEVFITLGGKTPKIHYDYPLLAAQIAKEKGAKAVFIVTAVGASSQSRMSYLRTKGEIERDLIALDFDHTHLFRPSMIMGNRGEFHLVERVVLAIWSVLNPFFIGGIRRYKGMKASNIARAMLRAAQNPSGKVKVYHWKDMKDLL